MKLERTASQAQGHGPVIPAFSRLKQEDVLEAGLGYISKLKTSQGYIVKLCFKNKSLSLFVLFMATPQNLKQCITTYEPHIHTMES